VHSACSWSRSRKEPHSRPQPLAFDRKPVKSDVDHSENGSKDTQKEKPASTPKTLIDPVEVAQRAAEKAQTVAAEREKQDIAKRKREEAEAVRFEAVRARQEKFKQEENLRKEEDKLRKEEDKLRKEREAELVQGEGSSQVGET